MGDRLLCGVCKECGKDIFQYDLCMHETGGFVCLACSNKATETCYGIKHDADKPRYDLLPPDALDEVVTIFTYGAKKYGDSNWTKGMKWGRCFGAAMRHLWAFWRGEDRDPESGHLHLAHAATNCLFLLAYYLRKKGEDDRK